MDDRAGQFLTQRRALMKVTVPSYLGGGGGWRMFTYTTLDGRVIDLSGLTDEERTFLDQCVVAYRGGLSWITVSNMVTGAENPLVRATGGWVTEAVMDHPLYQAVRDLEDRVGIAQGRIDPDPGDNVDRDPFADAGTAPMKVVGHPTT